MFTYRLRRLMNSLKMGNIDAGLRNVDTLMRDQDDFYNLIRSYNSLPKVDISRYKDLRNASDEAQDILDAMMANNAAT